MRPLSATKRTSISRAKALYMPAAIAAPKTSI
jgi:hypothetical protein